MRKSNGSHKNYFDSISDTYDNNSVDIPKVPSNEYFILILVVT